MTLSSTSQFWRDPRMPYVELRRVEDGRSVCYAPHTHTEWSMGAITWGQSTFVCGTRRHRVREGSLVFINPECVHACNSIDNEPWAYLMLYIDKVWLTRLRNETNHSAQSEWQDTTRDILVCPALFEEFCTLAACLMDPARDLIEKESRLINYLSGLLPTVTDQREDAPRDQDSAPEKLQELALYIDTHCADDLSLDTLSKLVGLSPSHVVRAFKRHFGLTPHAYLVNRRVQLGRTELKHGKPIAEAALNAGFADQSHFQRLFKRLVAATPNQYRHPSIKYQRNTTSRQ